jgi:hypothetical protein
MRVASRDRLRGWCRCIQEARSLVWVTVTSLTGLAGRDSEPRSYYIILDSEPYS